MLRECLRETLKIIFGEVTTKTKGPQSIPLVCNDFVTSYLPLKCNVIDFELTVMQLQHLCVWLYNRKFTTTEVELI